MAYLVQAIAILLAAGTAATAAPFSHRTHLKLKLQCVTCHASAQTSTKKIDNNLPNGAICRTCHQDGRSIKAPADLWITNFNHQLHLKLGNPAPRIAKAIDSKEYLSDPQAIRKYLDTSNACAGCHRGLEDSDSVTKAAFPQMADCLVCHNQIDPPFSCEKCHVPSPKLMPASHVQGWLDYHSSGKANLDKQSCAVCHGRRFTCRGCH